MILIIVATLITRPLRPEVETGNWKNVTKYLNLEIMKGGVKLVKFWVEMIDCGPVP